MLVIYIFHISISSHLHSIENASDWDDAKARGLLWWYSHEHEMMIFEMI